MKILIISDTHGSHKNFDRVIEKERPLDMLIHLGDVEGDEDYIPAVADCPVHMVSGNNDYNLDLPAQDIFNIGDYKVLVVHGHTFYVYRGVERLKQYALQNNIDIVMFGHTHKPYFSQKDGLTVLNPGSLSYPRQDGRKPSYMVMEIDEEGKAHYEQKYL